MAQTIIKLPETTINQIAAGEVVENPASVLKELIENSLDAKAQTIAIKIEKGGQQLIEIEDDGCGMSPEDAPLALERHATSKIKTVEDLQERLTTFGFRGEALAAIAAVSHLELKTSDGSQGTRISSTGGLTHAVQPIARNRGTTIVIRSLFFNVPARKKFQKTPRADTAAVIRIVESLALAYPEVAFSLDIECKAALHVSSQSHRERVEKLLGPLAHCVQTEGFWGFLGAPQEAKGHRREQYLFINRRPVFSPLIARAVQVGYGSRLPTHSYPSFVLFLELDPKDVDVNVHPQKKEARFADENALFKKVERATAHALEVSSFPVSFSTSLSFHSPSLATPHVSLDEAPLFDNWTETPLPLAETERPLAIHAGYLLLEKEDLLIIDLAAAHARVLFEELNHREKETQKLLWPLEVADDDPALVDQWTELGIEGRWIGPKKIAIDALPSSIEASEFPAFHRAWQQGKTLPATVAYFCKALKKFSSLEEAFLLWQQLKKCNDSLYDPLGKRIWALCSERDLQRWITHG